MNKLPELLGRLGAALRDGPHGLDGTVPDDKPPDGPSCTCGALSRKREFGGALMMTAILVFMLAIVLHLAAAKSQASSKTAAAIRNSLTHISLQDSGLDVARARTLEVFQSNGQAKGGFDGEPLDVTLLGHTVRLRLFDADSLINPLYLRPSELEDILDRLPNCGAHVGSSLVSPEAVRLPTVWATLARAGVDPGACRYLFSQSGTAGAMRIAHVPRELAELRPWLMSGIRENVPVARVVPIMNIVVDK
jgi:hypothetical protein